MIARLIISESKEKRISEIKDLLSKEGITNPHPDCMYFDSDQKLGIKQAREIKQFFSTKPFSAKGKTVVLEDALKLTDEAQNSLLKTLEELKPDSLFILASDSDSHFLPTVLSRCQITKLQSIDKKVSTENIKEIIQMDLADRFAYIEKIKDRHQFLLDSIVYFREKMIEKPFDKEIKEYVKTLNKAEEWALSNVNIRGILEYLMLVMPGSK